MGSRRETGLPRRAARQSRPDAHAGESRFLRYNPEAAAGDLPVAATFLRRASTRTHRMPPSVPQPPANADVPAGTALSGTAPGGGPPPADGFELEAGESVVASCRFDLDADLRFTDGRILLTDRRVLADTPATVPEDVLVGGEATWLGEPPREPFECLVQCRAQRPAAPAVVTPLGPGRFSARFSGGPDRSPGPISPGQAAVVYDGGRVLGGGWIES